MCTISYRLKVELGPHVNLLACTYYWGGPEKASHDSIYDIYTCMYGQI